MSLRLFLFLLEISSSAWNVREMRKPPAQIGAGRAYDQLQKTAKSRIIPGAADGMFTDERQPGRRAWRIMRAGARSAALRADQGSREGGSQSLKGSHLETVTQSHGNFREIQRGDCLEKTEAAGSFAE